MTLSNKSLRLKLSAAEFAVLLGALGIDSAPFVEGSELTKLNGVHLFQRLTAAREGLILRELVTVNGDDSLEVIPAVRDLLVKAVQPKAGGFQLFHTQAGVTPQRVYFSLGEEVLVSHRIKGDREHVLEYQSGRNAILEAVLQVTTPATIRTPTNKPQTFSVPTTVLADLAEYPPKPNADLTNELKAAGLSAAEAEAVIRAGLQPRQQTVLTAIALRGQNLNTGSALWFADEQTGWLLSNFKQTGSVTLQTATPASISEAVNALVALAA
jgi:hypothetical protein